MPKLDRIVESALYVEDLERARGFYEGVLGLSSLYETETMLAYDVGGASVLLLFRRGASLAAQTSPEGTIPPHGGSGRIHLAFAVAASELPAWEEALGRHDVAVEGRTTEEGGARSVYFRDPDGHLLELLTPGMWPTY